MKRFLIATVLAFAVTVAQTAWAGLGPSDARDYVRGIGDQILAALRPQALPRRPAQPEIGCVLMSAVDFDVMSRSVLGPSGRRASKADRKEFARLFAHYAVKDALDKLITLDATGFAISKGKPLPNGDIQVRLRIQRSGGKSVKLGFRVRDVGGSPRVVDVLVEGYSAAIHYQGVFERRARRDVSRALDILRRETAKSQICTAKHAAVR